MSLRALLEEDLSSAPEPHRVPVPVPVQQTIMTTLCPPFTPHLYRYLYRIRSSGFSETRVGFVFVCMTGWMNDVSHEDCFENRSRFVSDCLYENSIRVVQLKHEE